MYTIQTNYRTNPFSQFIQTDFHGAPTFYQAMLMNSVEKALNKGLFYTTDVFAFVTHDMKYHLPEDNFITPEYLARPTCSEHGPFGMDIYHCRITVESLMKTAANKKALSALMRDGVISVGKKLKGKFSIGLKTYSSITPESIDTEMGEVTYVCTGRGIKGKYILTTGANDTRILSQLSKNVVDKTLLKNENTDVSGLKLTTFTIDPTANRAQERASQYN